MRSLRSRLAVSYGFLTALALSIAVFTVGRIVFEVAARPLTQAVDTSAADARALVAADPMASTEDLLDRIERVAAQPGVVAILRPPPSMGRPFEPPQFAGPVPLPRPLPFPQPRPRGPGEISVRSMLGISDRYVMVHESAVVIAPDGQRIDALVQQYLEAMGIALGIALVVSWFVGRWTAELAIAPLRRVTSELRRFASGDFSQRPLASRDRDEMGELIVAYNGATAQVAAAFGERQRVEAHMRRFIVDAGHELRTPLTIVGGFLDLLEQGGWEDPVLRERAFATMGRETSRMRHMVERLMALARLERPESTAPAEIDLAELTRDAIGALSAARNGTVELRRADETIVFGDAAELHEAVSNLVDNALKYGAGSTVAVELAHSGDEAVLRVADGGPGIPQAERARLFERFYRGENVKTIEGSGLGLAIAAKAAERAGGTVVLENGEPGSTTFALRLPLHAPRRGAGAAAKGLRALENVGGECGG